MSIAEKLTTIAENEQKVYDAGKKAQYDEFWDNYQSFGSRAVYTYAFAGNGWTDELYKPKYPIAFGGSVDYVFAQSKLTKLGDLDMTNASGTMSYTFREMSSLKEIGEITIGKNISSMANTFYVCSNLETIKKLKFVTISSFSNTFLGCVKLKNIVFEGTIAGNISFETSSSLAKSSIISLFSALSSTTSNLTLTLSRTAVNKAFGINVKDPTTYPEGSEYYNLINTRTNWKISYA